MKKINKLMIVGAAIAPIVSTAISLTSCSSTEEILKFNEYQSTLEVNKTQEIKATINNNSKITYEAKGQGFGYRWTFEDNILSYDIPFSSNVQIEIIATCNNISESAYITLLAPTFIDNIQRHNLHFEWEYDPDDNQMTGIGEINGKQFEIDIEIYTEEYDVNNDGSYLYNEPPIFECNEINENDNQQQYLIFPEDIERYAIDEFQIELDWYYDMLMYKTMTPDEEKEIEFKIEQSKKVINGENAQFGDNYYLQLLVLSNWKQVQEEMFEAYSSAVN